MTVKTVFGRMIRKVFQKNRPKVQGVEVRYPDSVGFWRMKPGEAKISSFVLKDAPNIQTSG